MDERSAGAGGRLDGPERTRRFRLQPFDRSAAETVARWARDEDDLRLVAPYTAPPLTGDKVLGWAHSRQAAFLFEDSSGQAVAYGELIRSQREPRELWIAHVLVAPQRRNAGVGQAFTRALMERAFEGFHAEKVCLSVVDGNARATACYRRCGFRGYGARTIYPEYSGEPVYLTDMQTVRYSWQAGRWMDRLEEAAGAADWAAIWNEYEEIARKIDPSCGAALDAAWEAVAPRLRSDARAAILGCGPGVAADSFLRRFPGADATAIDRDPLALLAGRKALGERHGERLTFELADLRDGSWGAGREAFFDLAILPLAPRRMTAYSLRRLCGETATALARGGLFVFLDRPGQPSTGALARMGQWLRDLIRWRGTRTSSSNPVAAFWEGVAGDLGLSALCLQMREDLQLDRGMDRPRHHGLRLAALRRCGFRHARVVWRQDEGSVVLAEK